MSKQQQQNLQIWSPSLSFLTKACFSLSRTCRNYKWMTGRSALCTIEDLVDVIVDLSEWVLVEWPEMDFEWSS